MVEKGVQLNRDGVLGWQGECLSANKLGEISSKLVHDFVFDSVAPGTLMQLAIIPFLQKDFWY